MKSKIVFLLLLVFCFSFSIYSNVAGAVKISESPDIDIIIDGQKGTYNDVTLNIDGRTMLPLREVLVNLGVPNDNEHIYWDKVKKSITVKKDSTTIYLEVGKVKGKVNGKDLTLDVAPVIYSKNNRTYIPTRFVAESLGKKVIWDKKERNVLIKDEAEFDRVNEILTKSTNAMKEIKSYKYKYDVKTALQQGGSVHDISTIVSGEVSMSKKQMYMDMNINMGILGNMNVEGYYKDNQSYEFNMFENKWEKRTLSDSEYLEEITQNNLRDILQVNDVLSSGLVVTKSNNNNEIILKGQVYLNTSEDSSGVGSIIDNDIKLNDYYLEIAINTETNLINYIKMNLSGVTENEGSKNNVTVDAKIEYTNHNEEIEIVVPNEVLESVK